MNNIITDEELQEILKKHQLWLDGNKEGVKADLSYTILNGAKLSYANLENAKLSYANLQGVDLKGVDLKCADLSFANLSFANLRYADLRCANLKGANLSYTDLENAKLSYAELESANLYGTILNDNEKIRKGVILEEDLIGYKKLRDNSICTLLIPKGAIVFSINNSSCRTNIAKVINGNGFSIYDKNFKYKEGETITIKDFNLQYNIDYENGIHFFKTKKEAEDYRI